MKIEATATNVRLLLFSGWLMLACAVRAGRLDTNFSPEISDRDYIACHAVQADGRILIGGSSFNENGGVIPGLLARLNADGSLDATFTPRADRMVRSIALQPDGKILVAGDFASINGVQRPGVARLLADGLVDSGFAPSLPAMLPPAYVESLWILSSGKILIYRDFKLNCLNADGTMDTGFKAASDAWSGEVSTVVEHTDEKIMVAGNFYQAEEGRFVRSGLARLNTDGTLDKNFNPDLNPRGLVEPVDIRQALVRHDGKILVFGNLDITDGVARTHAARLNPDGSRDPGFTMPNRFPVDALALSGEELLIGSWLTPAGTQVIVEKVNSDGSPDPSLRPFIIPFDADGAGFHLRLTLHQGAVISAGGSVIVGVNSAKPAKLARLLLTDDGPLPSGLRLGAPIPFPDDLVFMGWNSGGALMVPLHGTQPGKIYSIEVSYDLRNWQLLDQAGPPGPHFPAGNPGETAIFFIDRESAGSPFNFYRAVAR